MPPEPDNAALEKDKPDIGAGTTDVQKPEDEDTDLEAKAAVDAKGQKVVPLAALHEERVKRRELAKKVAELEKQGERTKALEDYVTRAEPVIAKLRERPDLLQALDKGPSKPGADQPTDDPEAEDFAKEFGFFTEDGSPDAKRAQRLLQRLEKRTEKIADTRVQREIEPVRSQTAADRAEVLRQRAYTVRDQDTGRTYARKDHIDKVLDALGPELSSQEEVVRLALVIARGLGGGGQAASAEPLLSESAGGRRPGSLPMSPLEEKAAASRGIAADAWRKMRDDKSEVLE